MSENAAASRYQAFVAEALAAGDDPNTITDGIENALARVPGWGLWGDGIWRREPTEGESNA